MNINSVRIKNFKGVRDETELELRPFSLFIGENSSGKSTVIHALAALAQTIRQRGDSRPLVLDDETAVVHLGRFIEIVHSHSYDDAIRLGISMNGVKFRARGKKEPSEETHNLACSYDFKSTIRTQEIYIEAGSLKYDSTNYSIKKKKADYSVENIEAKLSINAPRETAFLLSTQDIYGSKSDSHSDAFFGMTRAQNATAYKLRSVYYLGPFRLPPQRRYQTRGASPLDVGPQGESTVTMLANEGMQKRSRKNITQIGLWLETMGIARKIEAQRVGGSDLFELLVTLNDGKKLPIADLGYGLSQVLPVLTQCSFAPISSTLLFEQPELHLHPLAQRPLAKVFIDAFKKKGHQFVIETHSNELLCEFIKQIRDGHLKIEDFIAYRVQRRDSRTIFERISIEKIGEDVDVFTNWQKGFCSEA